MADYSFIQFLVEDKSGEILVDQVIQKYVLRKENIEYTINSFKGIGKIPSKAKNLSQIKSGRLLTDLPLYLTGIDRSLENMPGKKAIFVIFDKDNVDCVELKKNLVEMYHNLDLSLQVFFCIAIEEMEAWLLGDKEAVIKAYPRAKKQLLQKYVQDSIVGTWEWLADIVYKGGLHSLKRDATSYYEIGKFKCECAQNIGAYMNIRNNKSESFNYFIKKLDDFYSSSS